MRRLICLLAGSLLLAAATATFAQQSYPSRPVRAVVRVFGARTWPASLAWVYSSG